MAARLSADASVATSQELLRSALQRSSQRNANVARRRLWLRWALWGLGQVVRYLSVPVLLVGAVLLWMNRDNPMAFETPVPALPAHEPAASAAAPALPREDLAPPSLQLRLDAELPLKRRVPQAQSRKPVAQDKVPAPSTPQETP